MLFTLAAKKNIKKIKVNKNKHNFFLPFVLHIKNLTTQVACQHLVATGRLYLLNTYVAPILVSIEPSSDYIAYII